jgi:hypothetical protein
MEYIQITIGNATNTTSDASDSLRTDVWCDAPQLWPFFIPCSFLCLLFSSERRASLLSLLQRSPTAPLTLHRSLACSSLPRCRVPHLHRLLLTPLTRLSPRPTRTLLLASVVRHAARSLLWHTSHARLSHDRCYWCWMVMVLNSPPNPTRMTGIDRPQPSSPLCCKCIF